MVVRVRLNYVWHQGVYCKEKKRVISKDRDKNLALKTNSLITLVQISFSCLDRGIQNCKHLDFHILRGILCGSHVIIVAAKVFRFFTREPTGLRPVVGALAGRQSIGRAAAQKKTQLALSHSRDLSRIIYTNLAWIYIVLKSWMEFDYRSSAS